MSENKNRQDELLDSNYDGIKEYDNDLPRWWLILFFLTIAFGPIYIAYTHVFREQSSEALAANQAAEIKKQSQHFETNQVPAADEEQRLNSLLRNVVLVESGRAVYATRCAPCHGSTGEGLVGPNLTDKYWLHGGKLSDIKNVIERGILDKGMVPWKGVLKSEEIDAVVIFIHSLQGTLPQNAKAPQGNLVE